MTIVHLGREQVSLLASRSRAVPSGAPPSPGGPSASSSSSAAQSSAAAKGTSDKWVHDAKCFGLLGWFRNLALLDKALMVALVGFLGLEAKGQYQAYQEQHKDDNADGSSGTSNPISDAVKDIFKMNPGSWQARTVIGLGFVTVLGATVFCCVGCVRKRKQRSATSHLRVRGESAAAAAGGCSGKITNFWKSLALLDKFLLVVLLVFGATDLGMQAKEAGVHTKIQESVQDLPSKTMIMLRGTPAPTAAPTMTPPPPPEESAAVVSAMEDKAGESKQPRPATCTADDFARMQALGMKGDECRGTPYTQACATSQLTKGLSTERQKKWLTADFGTEIARWHSALNEPNSTTTFFGLILGEQYGDDCGKVEEILAPVFAYDATGANADLMKSPKLLCNGVGYMSDDAKKKWGVQPSRDGSTSGVAITGGTGGKTLDAFVNDAWMAQEVKDFVHVGMAISALSSGAVTLARTRYLTFQYDYKGYWESHNLQDVVKTLDGVGHTCYWPGDDKLWRITECWQDFYGYKTYSYVVCVNRNLAPQLHERMEAKFKATIGS